MNLRLLHELCEGAPSWRNKERLSGDAVKVCRFHSLVHLLEPPGFAKVAGVFRKVSVEIANFVSQLVVAAPAKFLHHGLIARAV
eukprot:1118687-Rhodomonas_salina.1